MGGPSLPTQVVQSRSLHRRDTPGLYLGPWHHQIISLVQLMALSDDADWQPVCFPRLGVFISLSKSQKTTSLPASKPVVRKPQSSHRRNGKKTTGKMSPDVTGGHRDLQGGPHHIQHSHQNQRKSSKKKNLLACIKKKISCGAKRPFLEKKNQNKQNKNRCLEIWGGIY